MHKPFAITLDVGSSLANRTGSWRTERPVYLDRLPPCNNACPAGENIQAWLGYAEEGDYEAAWQEVMRNNPLPAIMGRACYHPCEGACNRSALDDVVNIHAVERFLGDQAIEKGWAPAVEVTPSGKKVLVIGAGEAGALVAKTLAKVGACQVMVTNRSYDKAEAVASEIGGKAVPFHKFAEALRRADILISCSGAPHYIIEPASIQKVAAARSSHPILLIDIAVPRDIDPSVRELQGVILYDIDDLSSVVQENRELREREADRAMAIVEADRSEERRVGKECRSRWSPEH